MVGTVDLGDGAFSELLSFWAARDFVSCPGVDSAAVCKPQLCAAWCGATHFSTAPLCGVYNEPYCGPAAPDPIPPQGIVAALAAAATQRDGGGAAPKPNLPMGATSRRIGSDQGGCAATATVAGRDGNIAQAVFATLCITALLRRRQRRLGRFGDGASLWP